jgi:transcriptional regulator with XRE-family HTH domain
LKIRSARLPEPAERAGVRRAARVSLREAAAVLGVAPMTVLRWERGETTPRRDDAVRYRQLLDALAGAVKWNVS